MPHHNPNIKQIQLSLPLNYSMNFSCFSISFTTTLRTAGFPTGPCSTFLSSCYLLTLQMEACLKRKKEKKKIILLSTLTFSPNFCFDSESYLSSYQGIKITTSFGLPRFCDLGHYSAASSVIVLFSWWSVFVLPTSGRWSLLFLVPGMLFLPWYLWVARSLTIGSRFKDQPFKCPSLPFYLKCNCAIHLLSCHCILFSLSTHPHLIVTVLFIHCFPSTEFKFHESKGFICLVYTGM